MDRLERLVNLVVALLDTRRPLTREELRERVGGYGNETANFRRAFERDKELLRQMGIPILSQAIDRGTGESHIGYWVPREMYEMADPGLDEEELMALSLAASLVAFRGDGEGAAVGALRKLAGAPAPTPVLAPAHRPAATPAPAGGPVPLARQEEALVDVPLAPELSTLFSAIGEKRAVSFDYGEEARRVDPYRLSYREGRWYLNGFDHSRGGERMFRVDRIKGPVEVTGVAGAFERPEARSPGPPPPWRLGDDPPVLVDLRVDGTQAPWVRELAGEAAIYRVDADGSVQFKLEVTSIDGFRSFVLGLLDHAEVTSPQEARDQVVSWLEAIARDDAQGGSQR